MTEVGGHLPFAVEYSKSNRASCKASNCKQKIPKDVLRMARMMKSRHHDGVDPNWFHFDCFWPKAKGWGLNAGEMEKIKGVDALRFEDQERVEKACNAISDISVKGGKGKKGKKGAVTTSVMQLDRFEIGYAPSGRAKCRKSDCKIIKIEKDELRIAHKEVDEDKPHLGLIPRWHHVGCFKKCRKEYDWKDDQYSVEMIPGFSNLDPADKKQLLEMFKMKKPKAESKNIKSEPESSESIDVKVEAAEDKKDLEKEILKNQSKKIWQIKDALSQFKKNEMIAILESNKIDPIPPGEANVLECAADLILFGRLPRCPKCNNAQLRVNSNGYYSCTGYTESGFTKCDYVTTDSKRTDPKIPKWIKDESSFFFKYKYDSSLIRKFPAAKALPPLAECKILILGKIKNKEGIEAQIKALGGRNAAAMDETVHFLITDKETFDRMNGREKKSERISKAETSDTMICDIQVLERLKSAKPILGSRKIDMKPILEDCKLSSWGSFKPPGKRKRVMPGEEESSEPKKIKLEIQNGAAIDPEAEVKPGSSIISSQGKMHTSMMTVVDLKQDKNSYYKLQAIQNAKGTKYFLFRSWGRIGSDTIGGTKTETFHSRQNCLEEFYRIFEEKTDNSFFAKTYVKKPGFHFPLDVCYNDERSEVDLNGKHTVESKLPSQVQDLMKLIFDVKAMKKSLVEFELDLEKMPLGKLSHDQLKKAYGILTRLLENIKGNITGQTEDLTTQFYHLVPHVLKSQETLPLLDNLELIEKKIEMVDNLIEIEAAVQLLNEGQTKDENENPIDQNYKKLNTDITVLDKESDEYKMIEKYAKNTHAKTHADYKLKINNVYVVDRKKETKKYRPFSNFENRQLLWHGSRVTNYGGILSQGLRIAPPEAPVTGYMFGKGIYFADMVSKSANYCHASYENPRGLALLAEVALGKMHECKGAEYIEKLPTGFHSCKGLGGTEPNPKDDLVLENGCKVPLGKGHKSKQQDTSLLYNEYIVYDISQVKMKYLIDFKFVFDGQLPW